MLLSADTCISDLWTLHILVFRGPHISEHTFYEHLATLVQDFSSVNVATIRKFLRTFPSGPTTASSSGNESTSACERLASELATYQNAKASLHFRYIPDSKLKTTRIERLNQPSTFRALQAALVLDDFSTADSKNYSEQFSSFKESIVERCSTIRYIQFLNINHSDSVKRGDLSADKQQSSLGKPAFSAGLWNVYNNDIKNFQPAMFYFFAAIVHTLLHASRQPTSQFCTEKSSQPSSGRGKSGAGRSKKHIGDFFLLIAQPLAALAAYAEAVELLKSAVDIEWHASCIESQAAAIRYYSLTQPTSTSSPNIKVGSTSNAESAHPPEIEALMKDAPKRWLLPFPVMLLGASNEPQLQHSDTIPLKATIGGSSFSQPVYDVIVEDRNCLVEPPHQALSVLSLNSLREAIQLQAKVNSKPTTALVEMQLRHARFLASCGEKQGCLEVLTRIMDNAPQLSQLDCQATLLACIAIALGIGLTRHIPFFMMRAAFSFGEHNFFTHNAAQWMLVLAADCVSLGSFRIAEWRERDEMCRSLQTKNRNRVSFKTRLAEQHTCSETQRSQQDNETAAITHSANPLDYLYEIVQLMRHSSTTFPPSWNLRNVYTEQQLRGASDIYGIKHNALLYSHNIKLSSRRKILSGSKPANDFFSSSGASLHSCWSSIQVSILELLRQAFEQSQNYYAAAMCSCALLSSLHWVLDAASQARVLQILSFYETYLPTPASLPSSLTVLPVSSKEPQQPPSAAHRLRRASKYARNAVTGNANIAAGKSSASADKEKPFVIGGIGRGSCPTFFTLMNLEVRKITRYPTKNNNRYYRSNNSLQYISFFASRLAAPVSSSNVSDPSLLPTEAHRNPSSDCHQPHENPSSPLKSKDQLLTPQSPNEVFLFSPWKSSFDQVPITTLNLPAGSMLQYPGHNYWAVNELQIVRVFVNNPLSVELPIDCATLLIHNDEQGAVEVCPTTIVLPPGPTSTPYHFDLSIVPKKAGTLHILGLAYSIAKYNCSQLLLKDSPSLRNFFKSYSVQKNGNPCVEEDSYDFLCSASPLLKDNSVCVIDVIDDIPKISASFVSLAAARPSLAVPCEATHHDFPAASQVALSSSRKDCTKMDYVQYHYGTITVREGQTTAAAHISIKNVSRSSIEYLEMILLQEPNVRFTDWLHQFSSHQNIDALCDHLFSKKGLVSVNPDEMTSRNTVDLSSVRNVFPTTASSSTYVPLSAGAIKQLQLKSSLQNRTTTFCVGDQYIHLYSLNGNPEKPTQHSATHVLFSDDTFCFRPESCLNIPLSIYGDSRTGEAIIAMRYSRYASTQYWRYLVFSLDIETRRTPEIYLNPKTLTLTPLIPFKIPTIMRHAFESGALSHSVTLALSKILKMSTVHDQLHKSAFNVDEGKVLLTLDVINDTDTSATCFSSLLEVSQNKQCYCGPKTAVRWLLPFERKQIEQFYDDHKVAQTARDTLVHILMTLNYKIETGEIFPFITTTEHAMNLIEKSFEQRHNTLALASHAACKDAEQSFLIYAGLDTLLSSSIQIKWKVVDVNNNQNILVPSSSVDVPHNDSLFQIATGSALTLHVVVQQCNSTGTPTTLKTEDENETLPNKGAENKPLCLEETSSMPNLPSTYTLFIVPLETDSNRNCIKIQRTNERSIGLFWSPCLEKTGQLLPGSTIQHDVTFLSTRPGTYSIFIGAVNYDTGNVTCHYNPFYFKSV